MKRTMHSVSEPTFTIWQENKGKIERRIMNDIRGLRKAQNIVAVKVDEKWVIEKDKIMQRFYNKDGTPK